MKKKLIIYLFISLIALFVFSIGALYIGVYQFRENSIYLILKSFFVENLEISNSDKYVFLDIRLARIFMAILVGSSLAVSGTIMQGIFKNPLATPDLIGITSGATLMAAITIVLGSYFYQFFPMYVQNSLLSFAAFIGALITTILVYRISIVSGRTNVTIMLLSGVALSSLGFAIVGIMIYLSKEDQLRDLTFWTLGSLSAASWNKNLILTFVIIVSFFFLMNKGKALNAMMLGEKEAEHLGVNVERIKKQIVLLTALMVGICVAFSGTIGFVGLIVPYILRLIFKSNYQFILPLSAVVGAILLLFADTLSRVIVAPTEVPIGVLTAFLGAPIFIAILISYKKSL